jgi:NADPH:quinone reductase-like Zn-dependent oxidoreductase
MSTILSDTSITNKCLVYGSGDTVQTKLKSLPNHIPRNHVLIKVHAAGLNPVDAKQVIGDKLPAFLGFVSRRVVRGATIGFEFSGTIVDKGDDDDDDYKEGDAVFGTLPPLVGTLSEYVVAPKDQICKMPSNLSYPEAACLPLVGLTALQALKPFENNCTSILIVGASGGTGHVAIQVAAAMGFDEIVAVCSTKNMEFCTAMGATRVVDYTRNQVVEDLLLSGNSMFDIVLDCVTSVNVLDRQHEYPKKLLPLCKTKYIRLGGPSKDWFYAGCERMLPVTCFGEDKLFWIRFPQSSDELEQLYQWCQEGKLKPKISCEVEFSPEAVQQAMDDLLSRRVQGKLVVNVSK